MENQVNVAALQRAAAACGGRAALSAALDLLAELQGHAPPATPAEALLEIHAQLGDGDELRSLIENHLISTHKSLCATVAQRAGRQIPLSADELLAAGLAGMLDAIRRFDPAKATFRTFAQQKAKFAMLDYAREVDPAPRLMRSRGEVPGVVSLEAIAEAIKPQGGDPMQRNSRDEFLPCPRAEHPGAVAGRRRFAWRVLRGVPREAAIACGLRYLAGWTQPRIGELLGVSESRVSQLCTQALAELGHRWPAADLFDQFRAAGEGAA